MAPDAAAAAVSRAEPKHLKDAMRNSFVASLPSARFSLRRASFALAAFVMLSGCGVNGDFGEINRSLVRDDIHDWIGRKPTSENPATTARFELTDDERQLRDLAYPLLEPPYNRKKFHSVASEYGMTAQTLNEAADRTVYFQYLLDAGDRSPTSRYAQLMDDIRNDTTRLPGFFEVAGRVLDIDGKRRKSMAYVSSLGDIEKAQAKERMHENARVITQVRTSLTRRAASYRYALERLVIMTPSPRAVDAERLLTGLQAQIAQYRGNTAPDYRREQSLAYSR